jgi:hypothetical protein
LYSLHITFNFGNSGDEGTPVGSDEEGVEQQDALEHKLAGDKTSDTEQDYLDSDGEDEEEEDMWQLRFQETIQYGHPQLQFAITATEEEEVFETVYTFLSKYGDDYFYKTYNVLDAALPESLFTKETIAHAFPFDTDSACQFLPLITLAGKMASHIQADAENKCMLVAPNVTTAAFLLSAVMLQAKLVPDKDAALVGFTEANQAEILENTTCSLQRYLSYFQLYLSNSNITSSPKIKCHSLKIYAKNFKSVQLESKGVLLLFL